MEKTQHDSETPAHGQQVFTAAAFIYKETPEGIKLFSPKRAKTKKFLPGIHELPGGHIDFGEDMKEGLAREVMEEIEMNVEIGECFEVFTYTNEIKGSHSIEAIYFAKFTDDESNIKLHPDDHELFIWVGSDEISRIINTTFGEDDDEIKAIRKGFAILESNDFNWKL